jgi:hypothetical protein
MPKIFVPNKSIHDFSAAEKFGELVFLSSGNMPRYKTSRIYRKFYEILQYSIKDDYLMISGLTVLNIVAGLILYKMHGQVNLLIFKSSDSGNHYIERTIV